MLVGVPVIVLLGAIVVPGVLGSFQPLIVPLLVGYPLAFATTFFLGGPLGEEPGWRGFALPRLQGRSGPLVGSLILGVLWALWHLPTVLERGVDTAPTACEHPHVHRHDHGPHDHDDVGLQPRQGEPPDHDADARVVVNTFANKVEAPLFPAPILNEYGLLPVLIGFTVTAIVLIIATRGRLGYESAQREQAEHAGSQGMQQG